VHTGGKYQRQEKSDLRSAEKKKKTNFFTAKQGTDANINTSHHAA
jgi:hypothetical protein